MHDDEEQYDLVLGGTGDLGARLMERLEDPVAVSRSGGGSDVAGAVVRADITADIPLDLAAVDTVYHLATLNSDGHPVPPADSPDVAGTQELVRSIEQLEPEDRPEVVYVSSAAAIDPPAAEGDDISYGAAKARGEDIAAGVGATIVRPGSVYGDGKGVISYFLDRAAEEEPLTLYGDGTQTRPFSHVEDAVDAILDAPLRGDMEVAEGEYSLNDVAAIFEDAAGVDREYQEAGTRSVQLSGDMAQYETERTLAAYVTEELR